jgi:TonB family protein
MTGSIAPLGITSTSESTGLPSRNRLLTWALIVLLTLILHFGVLPHLPFPAPIPVPRKAVKINPVDPARVEAIRKQWERSLLLGQNQPRSADAPPEARYFSDRNIRVEKEQRARQSDVLPRPGEQKPSPLESPGEEPRTRSLRDLALPLPLDPNPKGFPVSKAEAPSPQERTEPRPAGSGADQAVRDPSLPEGNQNLLNAQETVYYSFYARMYERIGPLWKSLIRQVPQRRKLVEGDYITQVDVVFDSEGNIRDVRVLQSSGVPEFDRAVETAWRQIKQVPNPPRELIDEQGEVHTGWSFSVRVGAGFNREFDPIREY